jgi:hypothetical protein
MSKGETQVQAWKEKRRRFDDQLGSALLYLAAKKELLREAASPESIGILAVTDVVLAANINFPDTNANSVFVTYVATEAKKAGILDQHDLGGVSPESREGISIALNNAVYHGQLKFETGRAFVHPDAQQHRQNVSAQTSEV